jgi:hypothetical protein
MRGATIVVYWLLSILFVLAALSVPSCILAAIWTGDGRWGLSAIVAFVAALIFIGLAATIEGDE